MRGGGFTRRTKSHSAIFVFFGGGLAGVGCLSPPLTAPGPAARGDDLPGVLNAADDAPELPGPGARGVRDDGRCVPP